MGALEIILLAAGAVIFIASFCIPVKQEKLKEETKNLAAQEIKNMVAEEMDHVRGRLGELSEEEMQQQIEKSERSMERISNEKIMAVNEYSDTVLDEIHKSHEEVVFLYDMLKNKKESLAESYEKADREIQDLLQRVKDSEITVRENLEELEARQKLLAERKKETVSYAEGVFGGSGAASAGTDLPGGQASAGENVPEQGEAGPAVFTEAGGSGEEKEAVVFQPFVPEKIEVVPKKKPAGKAPKKPEEAENGGGRIDQAKAEADGEKAAAVKEKPAGRKPSGKKASRKKESVPAERGNVTLVSESEEQQGMNSNERILELHRAGKSNMAIARELSLGIGEVKLVIDLYEGLR